MVRRSSTFSPTTLGGRMMSKLAALHGEVPRLRPDGAIALSIPAWIYVIAVIVVGLIPGAAVLLDLSLASLREPAFLVLLLLGCISQVYRTDGPNHLLFHTTPIVVVAGVFLLPPASLVLIILIPHLLEWGKEQWTGGKRLRRWCAQPFNIALYVIAGFAAHRVLWWSTGTAQLPASLLVVAAMLVTYVLIYQALLGFMLVVVRGVGWRESRMLTAGAGTELVLASLGYGVAFEWMYSPWLIVVGLAPIVLIHRALSIPKLQAENMRALQQVNTELSGANHAIHQLNDELFLTLAKIFDARDPYVGGHAAQVATYAVEIARELGLPHEHQEVIRQAAYLHDIGKMAIPEAILHKPSKLTDEEFEIIKTHAVLGAEFLETSQGLRHLAPFVRYHHERWDGRGYPERLGADAIPLEARILNVCDSVEAMASDRPYHTAMSVDAIIAEVRRCSGTQFDPTIADMFIRIAERDGVNFIVNSARTVEQKQADSGDTSVFNSGLIFAKLYQQAADRMQ